MKISINPDLKANYPHVQLGCIFYSVEVKERNEELWQKIEGETCPQLMALMETANVTEIENIAFSRQAYKAFGKDPGRYRVSSEALYRRIKQGKGLYKINTVVDVNNLISLETGFSVGSYDLGQVAEQIELRIGRAGESYQGIGKETINIENLPVLCDANGPFGSPTSDSIQAMITLDSQNIVTIIYCFTPDADMAGILEKAAEQIKKYAGAYDLSSISI